MAGLFCGRCIEMSRCRLIEVIGPIAAEEDEVMSTGVNIDWIHASGNRLIVGEVRKNGLAGAEDRIAQNTKRSKLDREARPDNPA